MADFDCYIRLTLLGDAKSGKSSFIQKFCESDITRTDYQPSMLENNSKIIKSNRCNVNVNLLEIGKS